jgi:uncharacterized protein YjeT (DUF2065 family)
MDPRTPQNLRRIGKTSIHESAWFGLTLVTAHGIVFPPSPGIMQKTRLSLYYLVTYLTVTGLGLMIAPATVLKMLLATHEYDDAMPRFAGILMFGLGIVVSQIIRLRVEAMYPITLVVRGIIFAYVLWLYFHSGDTLFAMVLGVVGFGMLLTGSMYLTERRRR